MSLLWITVSIMKHIVISSHNPVKIQATKQAFSSFFPDQDLVYHSLSVSSEVSDQPLTDTETLHGAQNRVHNAKSKKPNAHFWVGIEGGVYEEEQSMYSLAWIVISSTEGYISQSRTGTFLLAPEIQRLIHQGKELGEANDIIFKKHNSKQQGGTIGTLTNNRITRTEFYYQAMILALIPFVQSNLYQQK